MFSTGRITTSSLYPEPSIIARNNTTQVIGFINYSTLHIEFNKHIAKHPNFKITSSTTSLSSAGRTALTKAIEVGNMKLADYLIVKFGKQLINLKDQARETPLKLSLYKYIFGKDMAIKLIKSGADVNALYSHPSFNKVYVLPLDIALDYSYGHDTCKNLTKLLLQYGAQNCVRFTYEGLDLLNAFDEEVKLNFDFIKNRMPFYENGYNGPHAAVLEEAKREIYTEKFSFFTGLKDKNSIISQLPKELVASILTVEERVKPNVEKKAIQMINQAKRTMLQNEILFKCSQNDSGSEISTLLPELVSLILEARIAID